MPNTNIPLNYINRSAKIQADPYTAYVNANKQFGEQRLSDLMSGPDASVENAIPIVR